MPAEVMFCPCPIPEMCARQYAGSVQKYLSFSADIAIPDDVVLFHIQGHGQRPLQFIHSRANRRIS